MVKKQVNFKELPPFGRLTAVSQEHFRGRIYYLCKCSCGVVKRILKQNLVAGTTISCGCYNKEAASVRKTIHGGHKTPEYKCWKRMISRCYNKNDNRYKQYGERGITVCIRWLANFENFLYDMGKRPSQKHSIERVDNNKGYSQENCHWVTREVQDNNKTTSAFITYKGITNTLAQWSRKLGIPQSTLQYRHEQNYTPEQVLYKK